MKKFKESIITIFWLIFIAIIPLLIFFSPFYFAISSGNYWYLFLFIVSWIPAVVFGKIVTYIYEL